jgi:hypothetical protein
MCCGYDVGTPYAFRGWSPGRACRGKKWKKKKTVASKCIRAVQMDSILVDESFRYHASLSVSVVYNPDPIRLHFFLHHVAPYVQISQVPAPLKTDS